MKKRTQIYIFGYKEMVYSETLVGFNDTVGNSEKKHCFREMIHRRRRSPGTVIDTQQYTFFSQWYHVAVGDLFTHGGETNSRCSILLARQAKIGKTIALLKGVEFLFQGSGDRWFASDKIVSSGFKIQYINDLSMDGFLLKRNTPSGNGSFVFWGSIDDVQVIAPVQSADWIRLNVINQRTDDRLVESR